MALALRLTLAGGPAEEPEDFFGDALGVIFEDDTMNLRRYSKSKSLVSAVAASSRSDERPSCKPFASETLFG